MSAQSDGSAQMTDSLLKRRTVLATLPASVLVSQLASIRWAVAQDEGRFREQLQVSRDIAIELANDVRAARGEIDFIGASRWQELDYQGRSALATASLGLSQSQLYRYVQDEFRVTADTMIGRGVPLIPAPQDIVRLSTVRVPMAESCPPTADVMWDILLDALGLLDEREFFLEVVNAIDGASDHITRMNRSMFEGGRRQAIDAFFDLLEFLMDGSVIVVLEGMLGDRLGRKFLRSVTIRLVPVVGTGYAIVALGLAIHRHWDRLVCTR